MTEHGSRLAGYRHRRDHFFASHHHSPLNEEQRARFGGLDYFPERSDLALSLELDQSAPDVGDEVDLGTTDGKVKSFTRAGRVHFTVDGQDATLTVLRDTVQGGLFVPFRDASAGEETYEIGRYIEPQLRPDGTVEIDFNYAYNPFCAYGDGWSCPVPPDENRLAVTIPAGERAFRLSESTGQGED